MQTAGRAKRGQTGQWSPLVTGVLKVALRVLVREIRAGELTVLIAAMVIAVASITAVGLFTDRLDRGMTRQAAELLGADLIVESSAPISEMRVEQAAELGLQSARTLTMRSVIVRGETFQLVEAKAVGIGYPLRGKVRLSQALFGEEISATSIPAPGTAWIDPRLASVLQLTPGDTLHLGEAELSVGAVITYEPDRAGDVFSIAPRIMFNLTDVEATRLVQPGSRVKHRLLVAGPADGIAAFRKTWAVAPPSGERLQGVQDGRPEMRLALERARQFLSLAALSAVLLAGISIALSAQRYARRHVDTAGLLRCFGSAVHEVTTMFSVQLLTIGLGAGILGIALGFLAQEVLVKLLSELLLTGLPQPSPTAAGLGLAFGMVVLLGFGLPPLIKLGRVPPARVLRADDGGFSPGGAIAYATAGAAACGLILWFANDITLALYVIGATLGGGALLAGAAATLIYSLRGLRSQVGVAWRFGLANISRRGKTSTVQVVSFGLGLMALLLLAVVRSDLLETWQANLPPDTPNYFLINVQPTEADQVRRYLEGHGIAEAAVYPMIRGRLSAINGQPVKAEDFTEGRSRRLATREFNLSYSATLPKGNTLVQGTWIDTNAAQGREFSFEEGIARALGVSTGDQITFLVAGVPVTATITSLRRVKWESFDVNFFVLGSPAHLGDQPATFISSFYLPGTERAVLAELVRRFPSVTVIDVDALLSKVRVLMDQATRGVEFVFLFTLIAGLSVLAAAIRSTLDERRYESALIRTLGASRNRVWRGLSAEFLSLGALAGILAAGGASVTGIVLATQVFDLPYHGNPWVWLIGVPAGALGIGLAGLIGTRQVLAHPPTATLRAGTG